ncbi:MAG: hypothetical protein ACLP9L_12720 [Thermoguttaceae bacterium]
MRTFWQWLANLQETYFSFDPKQYNELFDQELEKVIAKTRDPAHRQALERMQGFNWMGYIAASVRNSGCRDQREIQEKSHDVAVKLLVGGLFRDYDERRHGPMDRRFRNSVGNAIRNMVELERNRRHYLPTVPIDRAAEPGIMTGGNDSGEKVIRDFRRLVKRRLGQLGVAVFNLRLAGGETKSLVGRPDLGSPGRWGIKNAVKQLKELARDFAVAIGDPGFLRDIERAMGREEETITKRRTATAARQTAGA